MMNVSAQTPRSWLGVKNFIQAAYAFRVDLGKNRISPLLHDYSQVSSPWYTWAFQSDDGKVHTFGSGDLVHKQPGVVAATRGTYSPGYVIYNGNYFEPTGGLRKTDLIDPALGYLQVATQVRGVPTDSGTFIVGEFTHVGLDNDNYVNTVLYDHNTGSYSQPTANTWGGIHNYRPFRVCGKGTGNDVWINPTQLDGPGGPIAANGIVKLNVSTGDLTYYANAAQTARLFSFNYSIVEEKEYVYGFTQFGVAAQTIHIYNITDDVWTKTSLTPAISAREITMTPDGDIYLLQYITSSGTQLHRWKAEDDTWSHVGTITRHLSTGSKGANFMSYCALRNRLYFSGLIGNATPCDYPNEMSPYTERMAVFDIETQKFVLPFDSMIQTGFYSGGSDVILPDRFDENAVYLFGRQVATVG
jgi:hypothetical protein